MNIEFTARADRDFADPTPQLKCRLASKVALLQKSPAPILLGREVRRQRRIWQGPVSRTIVSIFNSIVRDTYLIRPDHPASDLAKSLVLWKIGKRAAKVALTCGASALRRQSVLI
jgi:hypothetical protein